MATCERPVFPAPVIKSVRKQMDAYYSQRQTEKETNSQPESTTPFDDDKIISLPPGMRLKDSMRNSNIREAVMVELKIDSKSDRLVQEVDVLRGAEMIQRHTGKSGSLCLVALTLSVLAALYPHEFDGFEIFGIVKETGVDDDGLAEFQQKYFSNLPLYCDKSYAFYKALGDRKVGLSLALFNPLAILSFLCDTFQRLTQKKIDGNVKGEGFVQGGMVFFGKDGKPECTYEEETGVDLRVQDIVTAMKFVRSQQY